MRQVLLALICWMCTMTQATVAQDSNTPEPEPGPGISRALAAWRAAHYRDLRYDLNLTVAPDFERLHGHITLHWSIDAPVDLVLDWRPHAGGTVSAILANGRSLSPRSVPDHLIVPAQALRAGDNRIDMTIEAPVDAARTAVTRYADREDGARYLYSLFVPADASSVFPCIDQPDLKGRFTLEIDVPDGNVAVSNGPLVAQARVGARMQWRFAQTPPISTYVFAFAVGPFVEFADRSGGQRVFVRRSQQARAGGELAETMRLNREGVQFFEALFDRPFPFAKYDLVLLPEFPFGGMEHAGATFLREDAVLFPAEPTAADRLRRAQLIFHEASHQWFGDLVTMRWFDDLWLKEGFANLMAMRAALALLPPADARSAFRALKNAAYRTDVTAGTTPIWQALPNLSLAKSAYGSIVYSKAPAVLHQLAHAIGEAAFIAGVRAFLRAHAYGNATWEDLVDALESASGMNLHPWAHAWVRSAGLPRVDVDMRVSDGRIAAFALRQAPLPKRPPTADAAWPQRIDLVFLDRNAEPLRFDGDAQAQPASGASDRTAALDVRMSGVRTEVAQVIGTPVPHLVFANANDWGYGLFMLDAHSQTVALQMLDAIADPLLRAQLWDALWEAVRAGELAPRKWVELALRALPAERDEIAVAGLLGNLQTAMRWYLDEAARGALQRDVEAMHAQAMREAPTLSARAAWFRSYVALAASDEARAVLKALLDGSAQVPGMPLRSMDRFRIVRSLLASRDPDAEEVLARLRAQDASDDGRRHAYAAEAARADPATKARYFDAFLDDPSVPERWIEDALAAFNTVEQEDSTLPMLERALDALPRLQRERRIFFVNNWLAAFIGGQRSAVALERVRRFLDRAQLDAQLRRKVLEAEDALARTVRIRTAQ